MTLLTIYTPTYKRPLGLERCKDSIAAQSDPDYQHLIIEDTVGIGVGGMFRDIPLHHAEILGDYVWILCDDDVATDPHLVRDLTLFVADHDRPHIVMAKEQLGQTIYPLAHCWGNMPQIGCVTLSNWIVRRDVFLSVPYGHRYEGDFDFIQQCWQIGCRFAWWDRLICKAEGWGGGRPE